MQIVFNEGQNVSRMWTYRRDEARARETAAQMTYRFATGVQTATRRAEGYHTNPRNDHCPRSTDINATNASLLDRSDTTVARNQFCRNDLTRNHGASTFPRRRRRTYEISKIATWKTHREIRYRGLNWYDCSAMARAIMNRNPTTALIRDEKGRKWRVKLYHRTLNVI